MPSGVAADFKPNTVTFSWTAEAGKGIAAGAMFDFGFASWQNDAWTMTQVPEPASIVLPVTGLAGFGAMRRRRKSKAA